ncbi:MAG TPA: hypothetical protein VFP68_20565 [Burkholderiaceae bacterium]|nr:hypothetical protein [Burkholderiaceae bacterium]
MNDVRKAALDIEPLAQQLFAGGFYRGDDVAEVVRAEAPLRLMYALRDAGIQRWQLEAFVLALRDVGDAVPLNVEAAIDPAQKTVLDSIKAEEDLPVAFKALLEGVAPTLCMQKDLVAFYGVMNNVISKWDVTASILHKDADAL